MTLTFSIIVTVLFLFFGFYCRGIKRLKNTSRSMIFFGCLMALYSILTVLTGVV